MSDTASILQSLQPTDLDAGTVFSDVSSGHPVKGDSAPSLFTPPLDPNYILHESSRDLVVWFINLSDPLYVHGPMWQWKIEQHQATCGSSELPGL